MIDKSLFKEYAKLAIRMGVNVQKGQPLVINAPVEAYELIREIVKEAYEVGASRVLINYNDEVAARLDYEKMSVEELCEIPEWQKARQQYFIDKKVCFLHVVAEDPDLLSGIDPEKINKAMMARMTAMKEYRYYTMNNVGQWSILAYPNLAWAKKVFPNMSDDDAMNALWKAILSTSRIEEGKTIKNWEEHNAEVKKHSAKMNEYNFKSLHFKNNKGTDLVVGLIKDHKWEGGCDLGTGWNVEFNPNIPTEEVFTMPDRYHIDGKVVSTKPLSYNGNIISRFELTFKDGQIVDYKADDNYEVLKGLIEMDKGTKSLGEVALISHNSPISNSNILFYETLFDENASCHLAIGACYPTNIKGGTELTKEQLYELGGNDSMEHVDFMFGSEDMSIIGLTYDGKEIEVFKDGNFVF